MNKEELAAKYKKKLEKELGVPIDETAKESKTHKRVRTREYQQFKNEALPKSFSWYEKACNLSEKILKIQPDKKKIPKLMESIEICHLNVTPAGVSSFSILAPMTITILGAMISYALTQELFFIGFFLIAGFISMMPLGKLPSYFATTWRMKASNQMVLSVFYVVTYMRHTSNLEKAIEFAADHLGPPLSLDLKKVLWNVESGTYESVKESMDNYLESWRKWNLEFIEAFHLIESSLYEGSEDRRLSLLDKSLDVILDETYEKMLHYAQNLKSPITMLNMLGVILPILGLVILPLVVSFMEGVKWYHIAVLYNIVLPISIWYMGKNILASRPTGYGDTDISEENPELKKFKGMELDIAGVKIKMPTRMISIIIGVVLMILGLSPIILHTLSPGFDMELPLGFKLIEFKEGLGPFGFGASVLSLFIPLSLGLSIGLYFRLKSKNVIKIREKSKRLEDQFASSLFQLGNRLGDGLPAEIAFGKVADIMRDSVAGHFFDIVSTNIRKLGMSVSDAIFNQKTGALVYYPSRIIESSMKVLTQSIKKGPQIAAQALMNVARYIKEIHKVNERLKDLMADVISSMKSQINFMTPVIAGIVIGITSMITGIIGKLGDQMSQMNTGSAGIAGGMPEMFGDGVPTYYFQAVVGVYVVQIVYILTLISNGIENGTDKLNEKYMLGKNLIKSVILYCFIAGVIMVIFNLISNAIMGTIVLGEIG